MRNSLKVLIGPLIGASMLTLGMAGAVHAGEAQSETAAAYYKAAIQGSADAQANLGALYASGSGVQRSDASAFQWFLRAAEQGHPEAQLRLAEVWADGRGVPTNTPLAYRWAYLANLNATDPKTQDRASRLLDRVSTQMTDAQIAEARRWASAWTAQLESVRDVQPEPVARPAAADRAQVQPEAARRAATYRGHFKPPPGYRPNFKNARMGRRSEAAHSDDADAPKGRSTQRYRRISLMSLARRFGF